MKASRYSSHARPARNAAAAALLVLMATLAANAQADRGGPEKTAAPIAWPSPPAAARIRFVRTIDPQSIRRPPSLFARVWRTLVGATAESGMQQPYGVAIGPDRRIYVADTQSGVIHVYDSERSRYATLDVRGRSLIGIAASADRLFVTDSAAATLSARDLNGRLRWSHGPEAGLARPTGLAICSDRLYVVDTLRHQVVLFGRDGVRVGEFGSHGHGAGQFNYPTNIACGPGGRVYVTDSMNFRVQVFDADGTWASTFGRQGDGPGDFDKPKGVAVDADAHVYVVEGVRDTVQIFDAGGHVLLAFGGSGAGAGQLWLPTGIAVSGTTICVTDSANARVQVYEYTGAGR